MIPFRYVILVLGMCCLACIACNYNIINFTFICMTDDPIDSIRIDNVTTRQRYDYSPTEKSYIIWAIAAGTIVGTFPINWAYVQWGARIPFFICGVTSAVATGLTPIAAHYSLWAFVGLRFLQGLSYAGDFAALGIIVVRWSPLTQTAIFISILTCYSSLAYIVTNPLAGMFCTSSLGWRWAYYFHASVTLIFFALWLLLFKDDPQEHGFVSKRELAAIQEGKSRQHIERDAYMPYKQILTDLPLIAVWLSAFCEIIGYIVMLTYAPIYINKVLGFSVAQTAFLASIGSILHTPFKLIGGFLSDQLTCFGERLKMCVFNTIAVGVAGLFCGLIGFMPTPHAALASMIVSAAISGMNTAGFYKCATLHARQYAHFVLAAIQFCKCLALVVGPLLVSTFAKRDDDANGWRTIFGIIAVTSLMASAFFCMTATDQPAEFTKAKKSVNWSREEQGLTTKDAE